MTQRFWKLCAAGNDFVLIDRRDAEPLATAELAARLCHRTEGVGADGLIVITALSGQVVTLEFRNSDGSAAEFCGNGARCVGLWAHQQAGLETPFEVRFPGQTVIVHEAGISVTIEGPRPQHRDSMLLDAPGNAPLAARELLAGVPHWVFWDREPKLDLRLLSKMNADAYRRGNLTAVRRVDRSTVAIRTFERGAGETRACGSGALAAAEFVCGDPTVAVDLIVLPPGGEALRVTSEAHSLSTRLIGPARIVYWGELAAASAERPEV